jgi:hypothetical protein
MDAPSLTCIPETVTLCCHKVESTTQVRVRTSNDKKDVKIKALGFDPSVAGVDPKEGTTGEGGFLDINVRCAQDGPCGTDTTVTFDAQGFSNCTLKIICRDCTKAAGSILAGISEDESDAKDAEEAAIENAKAGAAKAERSAKARHQAGEDAERRTEMHVGDDLLDDTCDECVNYFQAAEDYSRAARLQRMLGNDAASTALDAQAQDDYKKAAKACDECGDFDFERGRLNAADEAYARAIKSHGKQDEKDIARIKGKRERIRKLIQEHPDEEKK